MLSRELEVAQAAALASGAIIRDRWGDPGEVQFKGAVDLVTEVDLASERTVLAVLEREFPFDGVRGEEGGGRSGSSGRMWYVDPLDGTTNFRHGFPHFCVSIALCDADGPLAGVVYEPLRDWLYCARRGGGATRNGVPMKVSSTAELSRALLETGFAYRREGPDNNIPEMTRALAASQGVRRAGSAALALAYVACGWVDGFWEKGLNAWDLAAGALLVAEAGGTLTGLDGQRLELEAGHVIATNGRLHEALYEVVGR